MERPDLTQAPPEIRAYVEALEAERLREAAGRDRDESAQPEADDASPLEPSEPPTTFNLIPLSAQGIVKRTPRHLYNRQRRGGMGIFDLETPEADPPAAVLIADEAQSLVVITERARALRLAVNALPASPIRSRGQALAELLPLDPGERPALILADHGRGYLILLTARGYVRIMPAHLVGEKMTPGFALYKSDDFGPPVSACWTPGDSDLFIATRQGLAIRFPEKKMPLPGGIGIRLDPGDEALAIASVRADSGVFLLGADGKGTIRLMSGFNANKSPGAGGKIAMKTDRLIGAVAVKDTDDLFIISRLSKLIRFRANDIPAKDGVVQGVNCMALRADETTAICVSPAA
jgi:DNA gyrase subunit A